MINNDYVLAATQGITPRAAATWYAFLKRTPRVLVPIHLDALIVRVKGGQWADCKMTTPVPQGETPVDLTPNMPAPFKNLAAPREKGAYLHWALPDALTRGEHGAGGTTFPGIPDRWLVMRLCPSTKVANRRTIRGWVLQAGDATATASDLDTWKETGAPAAGVKKPLTALGHGDVSWAAYYDNVVNRLGFYDSLSDVPNGPVAYVVCGWYADETLDPLADENIKSLTQFDAKMNSLGWGLAEKDFKEAVIKAERYTATASKFGLKTEKSFNARLRSDTLLGNVLFRTEGSTPDGPPYVTDGSWWPDGTLFHGAVIAIGWPGIGWEGNDKGILSEETGGPPPSSALKVVIGNTGAEALAELVEKKNNSNEQARLLEAFQIGAAGELDQPDGRTRVDSLLHAKTFGSLPGGDTVERVWEPPSGPEPKPPAPTTVPNPGIFKRHFQGSRSPKAGGAVIKAEHRSNKKAAEVQPQFYQMKYIAQENQIHMGDLSTVYGDLIYQMGPVYKPGHWKDLTVALPRFFHPTDPVLLVEGIKRSYRHGFDGRFSPDGKLECRLTGTCIHEYVYCPKDIPYPPIYPEDVLDRGVENGSVPPECDEILGEVAMLDPGSSAPVVVSGNKGQKPESAQMSAQMKSVMVEQTALWSLRDPRVDHSPLVSRSQFSGTLPPMMSLTPPNAPWTPLHLEWSIQYIPSAGGVKDWNLGENDYNESVPKLPPVSNPPGVLNFQGRSPITAGVNRALAITIRNAIDQISRAGGAADLGPALMVEAYASDLASQLLEEISKMSVEAANDKEKGALEDIATALESMDIINATFNGFHRGLRCGYAQDGLAAPADGLTPNPFIGLRSGFIKILRLRLVDCFGQFVDLAGSSASKIADPALILRTEPLETTGRPELLALPPRFTAPGRLWFRWMDAEGTMTEAHLKTDQAAGASPVCGYVMPDHLDRALEFFDAAGDGIGQARLNENSTVSWEDAPGRPASLGSSPASIISNKYLGSVAQSLIDWGIADAGMAPGKDTALGGLLRVIDSSLWAVDPFGHQGDEHLSLLVGHPIAVVRTLLRLELKEPIDAAGIKVKEVPVRLGALAAWQDGLLGYFVNDDYNTLHCPDAAAAGYARQIGPNTGFLQQASLTDAYYNQFGSDLPPNAGEGAAPVKHPYIDTSGVIYVHPNQDVWLTMFVEPHTLVHATTGLLPRKDIGMRREWVKDALAKLSPTFRFGPILIDPERIKMPIPHDINGTWSWDYRTDVNTWANGPVTHATQDAILDPDPPEGSEGWLRLTPNPKP